MKLLLLVLCSLIFLLSCDTSTEVDPPELSQINEPPNAFDLLNPPNNALSVDNKPSFNWQTSLDPEGTVVTYYLTVYIVSDSSNSVEELYNGTDTFFTLEDDTLKLKSAYGWFVNAIDEDNKPKLSQTYFLTTVARIPPENFDLTSPDNGNTQVGYYSTTFVWNATTGYDGSDIIYKFYYGENTNFSDPAYEGINTRFTLEDTLEAGSTYYWKVDAIDEEANVTISDTFSFTTLTSDPPEDFNLVFPTNNATAVPRLPEFKWNTTTDPEGTDITYKLYYGGNTDFSVPKYVGPDTSFTPLATDILAYDSTYNWKVEALDGGSNITTTGTYSFTTVVNHPPAAFDLITPGKGSANVLIIPTFTWNGTTDPEGTNVTYKLYYGENLTFNEVENTSTDTSFTPATPLQYETTYNWKVEAFDADQKMTSSDTSSFTTERENPPITLDSPNDNETNVSHNVQLSWSIDNNFNTANGPLTYDIYWGLSKTSLNNSQLGNPSTNFTFSNQLNLFTEYYWTLQAKNPSGTVVAIAPDTFKFTVKKPVFTAINPTGFDINGQHDASVEIYNNQIFVIFNKKIFTSNDGITWTNPSTISGIGDDFVILEKFDSKLYAISVNSSFTGYYTSNDGTIWDSIRGYIDTSLAATTSVTGGALRQPYEATAISYKNKLWVLGGGFATFTPPPPKIFSLTPPSEDFVNVPSTSIFDSVLNPTSYIVNNSLYLSGGYIIRFVGFTPSTVSSKKIFKSDDAVNWSGVADFPADFSPRYGYKVVEFDNQYWLFGGILEDPQQVNHNYYNDVWRSLDGETWTKVYDNDENPSAGVYPAARYNYGMVVWDNKIWILGGTTESGTFVNKIWTLGYD